MLSSAGTARTSAMLTFLCLSTVLITSLIIPHSPAIHFSIVYISLLIRTIGWNAAKRMAKWNRPQHWCWACSRVQWSERGDLMMLVLVFPWYSLFCLGSCCPWSRAEHWCHHWGHCASVKSHLLLLPGGSLGTGGSVIWGFMKIPSATYTLLSRGMYFKTSEKGWFVANKWGYWVGSQKEMKFWWSGWGFQGNWLSFPSW